MTALMMKKTEIGSMSQGSMIADNPSLGSKNSYAPQKDFAPIAKLAL